MGGGLAARSSGYGRGAEQGHSTGGQGGHGDAETQRAESEPTPYPTIGYTVYISPLLSVQILTVKIGKGELYLLLLRCVLCFFYEMDIDRGFTVWWFCLAGAL